VPLQGSAFCDTINASKLRLETVQVLLWAVPLQGSSQNEAQNVPLHGSAQNDLKNF